eukprot:3334193-Rhodomonas_salina.1
MPRQWSLHPEIERNSFFSTICTRKASAVLQALDLSRDSGRVCVPGVMFYTPKSNTRNRFPVYQSDVDDTLWLTVSIVMLATTTLQSEKPLAFSSTQPATPRNRIQETAFLCILSLPAASSGNCVASCAGHSAGMGRTHWRGPDSTGKARRLQVQVGSSQAVWTRSQDS